MNDIPQITTSSSVAQFADDTKCYRAIRTTEDVKHLQSDLDGINECCQTWRMNLNQSKCGILSVTRNRKQVLSIYMMVLCTQVNKMYVIATWASIPKVVGSNPTVARHIFQACPVWIYTQSRNYIHQVLSSYHLTNNDPTNTSIINKRTAQKDLGVFITTDLKWNHQISAVCTKANRMLGFIKRSTVNMTNSRIRCTLYKTLVRSHFAYSCQVWSPQYVSLILDMKKVQRRATRVIMSLPYQSETCYKDRLLKTGLLPLSYWHEYLDLICTSLKQY